MVHVQIHHPNLNAVADAMQWIFEQHGVKPMLHYLDDFLVIGAPITRECKQALKTAQGCAGDWGSPYQCSGEARAVLSPENDRSVHHGERNAVHD